jgi:type VI secretion system Hcp family effector
MAVSDVIVAIENVRTQQAITGESSRRLPTADTFLPSKLQTKVPSFAPFIDIDGLVWSVSRGSSGAIVKDNAGRVTANASPGAFEIIKAVDAASAKLAIALQSGDPLNIYVMMLKSGTNIKGRESPDLPYYVYSFENAHVTSYETVLTPGEVGAKERIKFSYQSTDICYTPQRHDGQPGAQVSVNMVFHRSA